MISDYGDCCRAARGCVTARSYPRSFQIIEGAVEDLESD